MLYANAFKIYFRFRFLKLKFDFIWEEQKKPKKKKTQTKSKIDRNYPKIERKEKNNNSKYFGHLAIGSNRIVKLLNYYHSRNII